MYKIIVGRGQGKTSMLIEMSAQTGARIVTRDKDFARHTMRMALDMQIEIPDPITYREFVSGTFRGYDIHALLIDDVDALVQWIASNGGDVPVVGLSMCPPEEIWLTELSIK